MTSTHQHLFFDLDGTVTPSRSPIRPHMAELLPGLGRTIIIVSGSRNDQMRQQIGDLRCFQLGQNGNHALDQDGKELWFNALTPEEKEEIYAHIELLRKNLPHTVPDEQDLIEDRGSQVSFSIYGHNASPEEKRACDGDFQKRKQLLAEYPFHSQTVDVQIGGSTCFDYFKRGYHKGSNVQRLIEDMKWDPQECLYFGDALFEGGNDASVNGIIETVSVTDEEDTYQKLTALFSS